MISLVDAVAMLRQELARAVTAANTQSANGVLMTVEEAQIELRVEFAKDVKARGEIGVWVVKIAGEAGSSLREGHTVTLKVKPRALDGGLLPVGARSDLPQPPPAG